MIAFPFCENNKYFGVLEIIYNKGIEEVGSEENNQKGTMKVSKLIMETLQLFGAVISR